MRKGLKENGIGLPPQFRMRGTEILRIDGFSDAVFAFAVTLLVVSLEVPHTYAELTALMRGFPAFATCFALLALLWFEHYAFFRKYGIEDGWTRVLTFALLFVVLFYVYPLKFLFSVLWNLVSGHGIAVELDGQMVDAISRTDMAQLMVVYGLGFAGVYVVFALLYAHAYRKADQLDLNPVERMMTRSSITASLLMAGTGLLSVCMALSGISHIAQWAGPIYMLIPIVMFIHGSRSGRKLRMLEGTTQT